MAGATRYASCTSASSEVSEGAGIVDATSYGCASAAAAPSWPAASPRRRRRVPASLRLPRPAREPRLRAPRAAAAATRRAARRSALRSHHAAGGQHAAAWLRWRRGRPRDESLVERAA
eukprot:1350004-Prymnesium_polylepis.1